LLSSFQLLLFLIFPCSSFSKKKKTLRDHNYSNSTCIKDYICSCNRLIERLWVSKWSWIFRSFLSRLQGVYFYSFLCYLLLSLYYIIYVFIHVCKYDPWRKKVKYLGLLNMFSSIKENYVEVDQSDLVDSIDTKTT